MVEQRLQAYPGTYSVGDAPSLADCVLVPQIYNARRFDCPLEDYHAKLDETEICPVCGGDMHGDNPEDFISGVNSFTTRTEFSLNFAPRPTRFLVPAGFAMRKKPGRLEYLRGVLERDERGVPRVVRRIEREGSGILTSLQAADGLIEIPEPQTSVAPGEMVWFVPFSELGLAT